jgi:dihydrofolate reductase
MARLIYTMQVSLDGYVADKSGNFDWTKPDEEVGSFIIGREKRIGTYLLGRKMYEALAVWETPEVLPPLPPPLLEFAQHWRTADKIVYSTTLPAVATARTRLERNFDADAVRALKAGATRDLAVAGPTLAAHAIRAGLVDEYQLLILPFIVGGGLPYLPGDVSVKLELLEERRFNSGMIHVRYQAMH